MQIGPVAEVFARAAEGATWECGSGYHLGSDLVLTAKHVVAAGSNGSSGEIRVRLLGDPGPALLGRVCWTGGSGVDAALVSVAAPDWTPPQQRLPVRFGHFVSTSAAIPCTAIGFPDARRTLDDGMRDTHQLQGSISTQSMRKQDLLSVSVIDSPVQIGSGQSWWQGMSGAAVFCGSLLTAIILQDSTVFGGHQLTALPIGRCMTSDGFIQLLEAHTGLKPQLDPVELEGLFSQPVRASSPAQLLRADVRSVRFRGRVQELETLNAWCEDPGWFSSRLLVGRGGQGKTRLAVEFMQHSRDRGWAAGLVRQNVTATDLEKLSELAVPVLLVVDYAETRTDLLHQLADQFTGMTNRVRLLMLARSDGDWRETAATSDALMWLADTPVRSLGHLEPSADGWAEAWNEAVTAFGVGLVALPEIAPRDWAAHVASVIADNEGRKTHNPVDESALGVHLEALVALLNSAEPALKAGSTMDTLLRHERRYWQLGLAAKGLVLDASIARRATAVTTLWEAQSESEALGILAHVRGLRDMPEELKIRAANWLRGLYPADGRFWGPLQPDRLGEHHVATTLLEHSELLIEPALTASPRQADHALTVLSRAAPEHDSVLPILTEALQRTPLTLGPAAVRVALQTGDASGLCHSLEQMLSNSARDTASFEQVLVALQSEIPAATHVLASLARRIAADLSAVYRTYVEAGRLEYTAQLAEQLNTVALRSTAVGDHEPALRASEEAVQRYRILREAEPATYLPRLAAVLTTLSNRLSAVGDHRAGLTAISEAISLYRELASSRTAGYLAELGGALITLSNRLSSVGDHDSALTASEDAVAIYQRLADADAALYLPQLAGALTPLSNRLHRVRRHEDAVKINMKAIEIQRQLADDFPDAYLPALAGSVKALIPKLISFRDFKGALTATAEVVAIYRRLARSLPNAYVASLADSLRLLAASSVREGDTNAATAACAEAIGLFRELVKVSPRAHAPGLGQTLSVQSTILQRSGKSVAASEAAEEAVAVHRELSKFSPELHTGGLVACLSALSDCLVDTGRLEDALKVSKEALTILKDLASSQPEGHLHYYMKGLRRTAERFGSLNNHEEKLRLSEEALALLRELAKDQPAVYLKNLIASMVIVSDTLSRLNRHDEALAARSESVQLQRQLAADDPLFLPELSAAINHLSDKYAAVGHADEALQLSKESVAICREVARTQPGHATPELASALSLAAERAIVANYVDEAIATMREAVQVRRAFASTNRDGSVRLAKSLSGFADRLGALGHHEQAIVFGTESVSIYRRMIRTKSLRYHPALAHTLRALAANLATVGRKAQAFRAFQESVDSFRLLARTKPRSFVSPLVDILSQRAELLRAIGRDQDVIDSLFEVVMLRRSQTTPGQLEGMAALAKAAETLAEQLIAYGHSDIAWPYVEEAAEIRRRFDRSGSTQVGESPV